MENMFFTTRRALRVHLAGLRDVLHLSRTSRDSLKLIPKDPRPLASHFRLDPVLKQYICCPKCHCLYPYNAGDSPDSESHPAQLHCNFQKTPGSPSCDAALWEQRRVGGHSIRFTPIRKHMHQDLKHWVGRMVARKGMEDILSSAPQGPPSDPNSPIDDIWLSEIFLDLQDSSGRPFFPAPDGVGRLVFSLAVDSFNPFHNKTAKQSASSTGIWMVLLNLPPHLRYLPENMYLAGVIPGPGKPSKDEINHALQLLVNDLLEFWQPGVYFSQTFNCPDGKLFQAMLVPLVADMIAARQVVGLPGVTTAHYFCTFCDLDIDDIDILDRDEWPQKDVEHIRHVANLYKHAQTDEEQAALFAAYGWRWSALFDLPYWNPVLYIVIDSMHALDLGLFQHHLRSLFKISHDVNGGDGSVKDSAVVAHDKRALSKDEKRWHRLCLEIIHEKDSDMQAKLLRAPRRVLYTICVDHDIRGPDNRMVVGSKWVLVRNIYHWVSSNDAFLIFAFAKAGIQRHQENDPKVQAFLHPSGSQTYDPAARDLEPRGTSLNVDGAHGLDDDQGSEVGGMFELPEQDGIDLTVIKRIIRHLIDTADGFPRRATAYNGANAAHFRYICDLLQIDCSEISTNRRKEKQQLFNAIIQLVRYVLFRSVSVRMLTSFRLTVMTRSIRILHRMSPTTLLPGSFWGRM